MPQTNILNNPKPELERFIAGNDYDRMIQCAQDVGESIAHEELTKSQLRNIYGMVKQIQTEGFKGNSPLKLKLLRPKLAYVAAKERRLGRLATVLDEAIQMVKDDTQFQHFADFFEAIVAYHFAESKKHGS